MIKMAAILNFKMEDEGVVGKMVPAFFGFSIPLLIKKVKKINFGTHIERELNT